VNALEQQKQKSYLKAEAIYRFLLGADDKLDTLVMCQSSEIGLVTTDQSLYEAVGAFEDKSKINLNKLTKLLEVVEVISFRESMKKLRRILTDERVSQITGQGNNQKFTKED